MRQRLVFKMFLPLDPEEILDRLNLQPDMIAADFGSGHGIFAIPLAKKLNRGLVYAVDVQKQPLSILKNNAISTGLGNVHIINSDLEKKRGSGLSDDSVDLLLLINTLFQSEEKEAIIKEAKRVLKEKGKLVVVDAYPFRKDVEECGFLPKLRFNAGNGEGIVFEKT